MTPKENEIRLNALELYSKYHVLGSDFTRGVSMHEFAKQCALTAVDAIIKQCWDYRDVDLEASYSHWQQVKQEIEKL